MCQHVTSSLINPMNKLHYQNINSQSQSHLCIHEPIDTVWQPASIQNALSLLSISKVPITLIKTSTNSSMLLFLNIWEIYLQSLCMYYHQKEKGGEGGLWLHCSHSLCKYTMMWYKNSTEVTLDRQHFKQHISKIKKPKSKKLSDQLSTSSGETVCPNLMLALSPVTSVSLGHNEIFVLTGNALLSIYSHMTFSLKGWNLWIIHGFQEHVCCTKCDHAVSEFLILEYSGNLPHNTWSEVHEWISPIAL